MKTKEHKELSEAKILSKIKGKTLLVYWELLKTQQPIGVRDLQRNLNFSSPSVAAYHLNKLLDLQVAIKNGDGSYQVKKKVPLTELANFLMFRLANRVILLPRYVFYLSFFILLSMGYFFFFFTPPLTTASFFVFIFSLSTISFSLYETVKVYQDKPW